MNLDVLVNSSTGTPEGTLLQKLDSCKTSFGWILKFLCIPVFVFNSIIIFFF